MGWGHCMAGKTHRASASWRQAGVPSGSYPCSALDSSASCVSGRLLYNYAGLFVQIRDHESVNDVQPTEWLAVLEVVWHQVKHC